MHLENLITSLAPSAEGWLAQVQEHFAQLTAKSNFYPLRFAITHFEGGRAQLETTALKFAPGEPYTEGLREIEILEPKKLPPRAGPFVAVQIIPTGIGCEIGGFAGDAAPVTNLLAAASEYVITHPNAVNASDINHMEHNVLYVEGKLLDDFLLGHIALEPRRGNRVGTVVDPTGEAYLNIVLQTLNASLASAGIRSDIYIRPNGQLGARVAWSSSGCAIGTVDRPDLLVDAVNQLLESGCDAIGAVSVIHGVSRQAFVDHQLYGRPNPSGGVEAIITHLISKIFRVPSAHAPLPYYTEHKRDCPIDPRSAAEFISTPHYFSVLKGLSRAPRPLPIAGIDVFNDRYIFSSDVRAIILPASALGGIPALAAQFNEIPIIAVRENGTILAIDNRAMRFDNVIEVKSYAEAAGIILALRYGISLSSIRRPLEPAKELRVEGYTASLKVTKPRT